MANGHGGARTNAGRPRLAEKFADQIAATEDQIGQQWRLSRCVDNIQKLADGGYPQWKEEWKAAGLVFVEEQATRLVEFQDRLVREPVFNKAGVPVMVKVRAFPHLNPTEMVCISKTKEDADPDRQANEYQINRILGKPHQDLNIAGKDGGAVEIIQFRLPYNGRDAAPDGDQARQPE